MVHEDDLMIIFSFSLKGDVENWFYDLPEKSIVSMVDFFKCFLLRWYEGEVGEIKQLVLAGTKCYHIYSSRATIFYFSDTINFSARSLTYEMLR